MREKRGPWTKLKSRIVYKNPWITVHEDAVITPGGTRGIYGVIDIGSGASVIAMDDKQNVYLTKEYHYPIGKATLEAVSGAADGKERPLVNAKRELKEEAGITAKYWTLLGVDTPLTSLLRCRTYMYLAEGLTFGTQELEPTESIVIEKIPFKKALALALSGKINHSATVLGLLRIARLKGL